MAHAVCSHAIIKQTVNIIKEVIFSTLSMMLYFSDGCAEQYKNYKNFINCSLHEKEFSVKYAWSFVPISHGKSPCNGLGGALKRLTEKASILRTHSRPILTAKHVFEYCDVEINGAHVIFQQKRWFLSGACGTQGSVL